jgi:hypothetical protein
MSGTLGAKYEKLGGDVRWMGKPDKVVIITVTLICFDLDSYTYFFISLNDMCVHYTIYR